MRLVTGWGWAAEMGASLQGGLASCYSTGPAAQWVFAPNGRRMCAECALNVRRVRPNPRGGAHPQGVSARGQRLRVVAGGKEQSINQAIGGQILEVNSGHAAYKLHESLNGLNQFLKSNW